MARSNAVVSMFDGIARCYGDSSLASLESVDRELAQLNAIASPFVVRYYPSASDVRLVLVDEPAHEPVVRDELAQCVSGYGVARVYRLLYDESNDVLTARALARTMTDALAEQYRDLPFLLGSFSPVRGVDFYFPQGYFGKAGDMPDLSFAATRDGISLAFREYASSGPLVVILLHGATAHDALYAPLARFLAGRGRARVLALTLRGHGKSGGRRGDVEYARQYEHDLADFIVWVRRESPKSRIVLLGHSLGAGLALRFSSSPHAGLVDGYILVAPYLGVLTPRPSRPGAANWMKINWGIGGGVMLANLLGITRWHHLPLVNFQIPTALLSPLETASYSYQLWWALSPPWNYRRALQTLKRPVLILVGTEDEMVNGVRYPRIVPHIANIRVELLDRATHFGIVYSPQAQSSIVDWLETEFG